MLTEASIFIDAAREIRSDPGWGWDRLGTDYIPGVRAIALAQALTVLERARYHIGIRGCLYTNPVTRALFDSPASVTPPTLTPLWMWQEAA